ncbi:hypothetical protein GCM10023349_13440 [Nocardioides conyzicola]|uniref:Uncharacterized protein n=1 Tax=Nocardioides conyzicola TaxID=1651781 RepID=A0ABP8X287_9ACTN
MGTLVARRARADASTGTRDAHHRRHRRHLRDPGADDSRSERDLDAVRFGAATVEQDIVADEIGDAARTAVAARRGSVRQPDPAHGALAAALGAAVRFGACLGGVSSRTNLDPSLDISFRAVVRGTPCVAEDRSGPEMRRS